MRNVGLKVFSRKIGVSLHQKGGSSAVPLLVYTYSIITVSVYDTSNGYTMGFPPVRGDNPRALASGLSYVQVDKHGITILYHHHQCRPCTPRDISC